MLLGLRDDAAASRQRHVLANGTVYWKSTFINPPRPASGQQPNAFLVEQAGDSEILPHFHQANQFQVFVSGHGRLGRHEIAPITVHYTSAHSPYGPILSGERGLHYYTLRDDADPGARFLPGAIAELKKGSRRYATSAPMAPPDPARIERLKRAEAIACEADGLGAVLIDAPGGTEIATAIGPQVNDRYLLVVAGAIALAGQDLAAGCCLFLPRGEAPRISALPCGASVAIMQFPTRDAEGSRPPP